jgi:hypothetical protein
VGGRPDLESAADRFDSIDHVSKSGAAGVLRHVKAGPIVNHFESK